MSNNPIVEFVAKGGDLNSEAGASLIEKTERQKINEAAKEGQILQQLVDAMNNSSDPYLRRKILLALSD
ncbi:hypothetical protein JW977_03590 [Candidatus Falkowbacteria bacterium]|nr:hypothetical protein [Candidatus Falkowbacteria bacterium]